MSAGEVAMSKGALNQQVVAREGEARAGLLQTRRALVETPVFMPVDTAGTVKGMRFESLESAELDAPVEFGR
jgi:queuine tRNA-ribosyltransferase